MNSFYKQLFISLIITLLLIAALTTGLIFFGANIKKYSSTIEQHRREFSLLSTNLSSLAVIKNQYNTKVKDYLKILDNVLPSQDQLINFLKDFQSLAAAEQMGFGFTFANQIQPTENSLGIVNFNVSLQGTLDQFLNFLNAMKKLKFIVTFENVNLTPRENQNFQINLKGSVFFK